MSQKYDLGRRYEKITISEGGGISVDIDEVLDSPEFQAASRAAKYTQIKLHELRATRGKTIKNKTDLKLAIFEAMIKEQPGLRRKQRLDGVLQRLRLAKANED